MLNVRYCVDIESGNLGGCNNPRVYDANGRDVQPKITSYGGRTNTWKAFSRMGSLVLFIYKMLLLSTLRSVERKPPKILLRGDSLVP